jgi:hypothetical protein
VKNDNEVPMVGEESIHMGSMILKSFRRKCFEFDSKNLPEPYIKCVITNGKNMYIYWIKGKNGKLNLAKAGIKYKVEKFEPITQWNKSLLFNIKISNAGLSDAVIHDIEMIDENGNRIERFVFEFRQGDVLTVGRDYLFSFKGERNYYRHTDKAPIRIIIQMSNDETQFRLIFDAVKGNCLHFIPKSQ